MKDIFDLSGKVIVITGGLGLLGRQFTSALLERGAIVNVIDLQEPKKSTKKNVNFFAGDITSKNSIKTICSEIILKYKKIDVLINNAAINPDISSQTKTFENMDIESWNKEMNVNLTGTMLCSQIFGAKMKSGASIINISSIYGVVGPDQSIYKDGFTKPASYSVSKGGMIALTRYLAAYWGKKSIRVNCLVLGGVENGQSREFIKKYSEKTPMSRMARPNEFDGVIIYLASTASSYSTGSVYTVDGGFTTW